MLVLITLFRNAHVAGKYENMVVLGSALCWQRWRKFRAASKTRFLCLSLVTSMVVDLPRTISFCMSRKRVTAPAWRKTLAETS